MKKIAFILSCVMIMALLVPVFSVSADELPTPISTADEFIAMSGVPGNYQLTGDIDFAGKVFDKCILEKFDGTLDGDGHKLFNYSFDNKLGEDGKSADSALILKVGSTQDTVIKNLNIGSADAPIAYSFEVNNKSYSPFAAVISNNDAGTNVVFENINVYADLTAKYLDSGHKGNVGGFIAYCCKKGTGTLNNCTFNGTINAGLETEGTVYRNAGAFVSANNLELTFNKCTNNASVTQGVSSTEARASGFVAYSAKPLVFNECVNNGKITVNGEDSDAQVSGFACDPRSTVTMTKCINNGDLFGCWYVGGLIAMLNAPGCVFTDCTNNGDIDENALSGGAAIGLNVPELAPELINFVNTGKAPAVEETTAEETTEEVTTEEETTAAQTTDNNTETTKAPDADVTTTVDADDEGCGSLIAGSAIVVALLATALIIKKRD